MEVGRVGTENYSPVPLTEPYVRFTHTAPWIDRSEPQRKLGRYRRRAGVGTSRLLVPRYMRQNVPPPGYVRWLDRSAPRRGCRRSPGPIVVVPSFSIHLSLRSVGFHRLRCYYEEIRLPRGLRPVVVASSGSTARAGPRGSPWVRTLNVPRRPPPLPPRPRLDFGRRVRRHADPAGPACSEVHSRSVPRFASGFFPTRPHGAGSGVSRRHRRVRLPPARGCYQRAPRRTFTSNPVPMPGTPPLLAMTMRRDDNEGFAPRDDNGGFAPRDDNEA